MADEFAVISGHYAVARDSVGGVALEVHHHPAHAMNVSRVIAGVKRR